MERRFEYISVGCSKELKTKEGWNGKYVSSISVAPSDSLGSFFYFTFFISEMWELRSNQRQKPQAVVFTICLLPLATVLLPPTHYPLSTRVVWRRTIG